MDLFDLANGCFEAWGGFTLWRNVKAIRRDKQIRGVNWKTTRFFTVWGFFNTLYYPHIHQWLSFSGGLIIVIVNCIWLHYAIKYRNA